MLLCDAPEPPPWSPMGILGSTKDRIMKEIGKGPVHGYELANRLGISLSSVYEHLRDLRESGLVEATGNGRRRVYTLTEKGRHLLKALG
jgi:DNA-binding PadR family transcriptional regulator